MTDNFNYSKPLCVSKGRHVSRVLYNKQHVGVTVNHHDAAFCAYIARSVAEQLNKLGSKDIKFLHALIRDNNYGLKK